MIQNKKSPTCCEIVGLIFYVLFRIFIIVCPIVAQIRVIYILCKKQEFIKHPDQCKRILSHIELAIGLYIVFYLIGYMFYFLGVFVKDNFSNRAEPIKMHIAQTIAGLIILKIYYELFVWGYHLIYDHDADIFQKIVGTIVLSVLTIGLFLIYRYFQLICKYWYSQNKCYRETARFTVGFGVFYIYYKMWQHGLQWYYQEQLRRNYIKAFFGFCLLIFATLGIIILVEFVRFLCKNFNSQDSCKRQLSRCIIGLGIFYVYINMLKYGYKWMYQQQVEQEDQFKVFCGFIFLTIGTFGLYLIYKPFEFICKYWNNEILWKREIARFFGSLMVPYIFYHIIKKNYRLVKESNSIYQKILGFIVLTIFTFGIILIVQLFKHGCYNIYDQDNIFFEFLGHIQLTILTFGLFIPYRLIEFVWKNWNSQVSWKRQISRFLGSLGIFYLWYHLIQKSSSAVYNDHSIFKEILGRIGLTIGTFGFYIFYMIYEFIKSTCTNLNQHYFMSEDYIKGVLQLSIPTFGIFGLITLTLHQNRWLRYIGHFILILINGIVACLITLYVTQKYSLSKNIQISIIVLFVLASYPCYVIMRQFILFNQVIRRLFDSIMKGLIIFGRGFVFVLAKIYYPLSIVFNAIGNSFKKFGCMIQTSSSRTRAFFSNRKWIWQGYYFRIQTLQIGDEGYTAPVIYQPNITQIEPFKSWEERQLERVNSPEYKLNELKQLFIFIIKCIMGKLQHEFNHTVHRFSSSNVILWVDRYYELQESAEKIKRYYEINSRLQTTDICNPNNFKQVQSILTSYSSEIRQISRKNDINYFMNIEQVIRMDQL